MPVMSYLKNEMKNILKNGMRLHLVLLLFTNKEYILAKFQQQISPFRY